MRNKTYFQKSSELVNRGTHMSVISEISKNKTKNGSSGNRVDLGFLCIDFLTVEVPSNAIFLKISAIL